MIDREYYSKWNIRKKYISEIENNHLRAYSAQGALYVIMSMVPCILLLLTLIQYTTVTKENILTAVVELFPSTINAMIVSIVNEVYSQSMGVIPITAIVAMWSASRGVLAMTNGMNYVYGDEEPRGYIYLRIRSSIYTVIFLIAIVLTLALLVFGNSISVTINSYLPMLAPVMDAIISIRVVVAICLLTVVFTTAYTFLPDKKLKFLRQCPGAIFTTLCWLCCSLAFSMYVDVFKGFSDMYGSLTTIVLIMLWLNYCMYFMLIGAKLNVLIEEGKIKVK